MNTTNELLDLQTLADVQKATPHVTLVSADFAKKVLRTIELISQSNLPSTDVNEKKYWEASLKDLHKSAGFGEDVTPRKIGMACKSMGLFSWRMNDGYHVAWSEEQLNILKQYFSL